ncbi:rCG63188 [Rattus norvegicus]|uniref:RCG63188 n=1 Tax=Rattus norvegicus TaxID=10116 RepID=A6JYS6_RAT|nr:rCG63188 [Rattus norvegicus]
MVNPPCLLPLPGERTGPSQPRRVGSFCGGEEEELLLRTDGLWGLGHHLFYLLQI